MINVHYCGDPELLKTTFKLTQIFDVDNGTKHTKAFLVYNVIHHTMEDAVTKWIDEINVNEIFDEVDQLYVVKQIEDWAERNNIHRRKQ
jgi:hypothetical protein